MHDTSHCCVCDCAAVRAGQNGQCSHLLQQVQLCHQGVPLAQGISGMPRLLLFEDLHPRQSSSNNIHSASCLHHRPGDIRGKPRQEAHLFLYTHGAEPVGDKTTSVHHSFESSRTWIACRCWCTRKRVLSVLKGREQLGEANCLLF